MTENLKEKTNKTVDNTHMAAGTAHNYAKVNTSDVHNDLGMKSSKMSDTAKMSTPTIHNDTGMKAQKMSDSSADSTKTKSMKEQIHAHISECLVRAKFPIKTAAEFIAAFPNGAATSCTVGNIKMTAGDAGKLLKDTDFPFKSANSVADVIVSRASL